MRKREQRDTQMPALPGTRIRINRTTEFLDAKARQITEIHAFMHAVNCSAYAFKVLVVELHRIFRSRRHSINNEAQPGKAHIAARVETFAKIEASFRVQTLGNL
jgi:hypothetical protein